MARTLQSRSALRRLPDLGANFQSTETNERRQLYRHGTNTKMKTYEIRFTGRRVNAIGSFSQIDASRFANSPEEAIRLLYEPLPVAFEHVSLPDVREIPSPFCASALFNLAQNERGTHESFAHWVNMMISEMSRVARRAAKANADWHDDPDSADHAPVDQQYPAAMQLEAVAEVVLYFLRERPAGLPICDRLTLAGEGAQS